MCRMVIAAVLAIVAIALAMERPDAPGDIHSGPRVACQPDRDQAKLQIKTVPTPTSVMLEQMSPAERANARISVEFDNSDAEAIALGREVERLWNGGQFDEALAQLGNLETRIGIGRLAIGNSWRKPVPTLDTRLWDNDVRIGNRDSLMELAFDQQLSSGRLFVVVRHGTQSRWYLNMSSDGGASWSEAFNWGGTGVVPSVDAAVLANDVYVVYNSPGEDPRQVRLRRFDCVDGTVDSFSTGESWVVACTLDAGDSVKEMSIVSNQYSSDDRLYVTTLVSDGSVAYCWDDTGAVSWTRVATGVTSGALNGLDATWNQGFDSTFLFFSYYDASDSLRIYGRSSSGNWTRRCSRNTGNAGDYYATSISAYGDTIICAFDDCAVSPYRVVYMINYGDVATWNEGTLSDPDTTAEALR